MLRQSLYTLPQLIGIPGTVLADIAHSRAEIDQARLLVLAAARQIDLAGAKAALKEIGIAKVSHASCLRTPLTIHDQFTVPATALRIIDRAMQVHGAEGLSDDTPLPEMYAGQRTLRYADVRGLLFFVIMSELNKYSSRRVRTRCTSSRLGNRS